MRRNPARFKSFMGQPLTGGCHLLPHRTRRDAIQPLDPDPPRARVLWHIAGILAYSLLVGSVIDSCSGLVDQISIDRLEGKYPM